jgi:hypothetical protein
MGISLAQTVPILSSHYCKFRRFNYANLPLKTALGYFTSCTMDTVLLENILAFWGSNYKVFPCCGFTPNFLSDSSQMSTRRLYTDCFHGYLQCPQVFSCYIIQALKASLHKSRTASYIVASLQLLHIRFQQISPTLEEKQH